MSQPSVQPPPEPGFRKQTVDTWQVFGGVAGVLSLVTGLSDNLTVQWAVSAAVVLIGVALLYRWGRSLGGTSLGGFAIAVLVTILGAGMGGAAITAKTTESTRAAATTGTSTSTPTTSPTTAATGAASPTSTSPQPALPDGTGASTKPYVDKELAVPHPDGGVEIDFDKPVASTSSLATGTDLEYTSYDGLRLPDQVQIGTGPAERPNDPNVCADSAQTRPIQDPTEAETIEVGMAFCVITDKGNIVWFTVTHRSQDKYSPGFTFLATLWSR